MRKRSCISGWRRINKIYKIREDEIESVTESDKKQLLELMNKRKEKNKQLEIAIDNLPDICFEKTVDNLKKKIEEKLEVEYDINAYYNEKSYKMGFEDAVRLIVGSRKN